MQNELDIVRDTTKASSKWDCIVRKQSEYRLNEFNRRQRTKIQDFETWIVSKEDLISRSSFGPKIRILNYNYVM